jgi:hypothetical protein
MWSSRLSLFAVVAVIVGGCSAPQPTQSHALAFRCEGQSDQQAARQYGMTSLVVTADERGPVLEYSDMIGAPARFHITSGAGRCTIQPAR